jgi:hypothetical protein
MARICVTHVGDQTAALPERGAELVRHLGPGARLERTGADGAGPYVYACEGDEAEIVRSGWRALEATGHASEWKLSLV